MNSAFVLMSRFYVVLLSLGMFAFADLAVGEEQPTLSLVGSIALPNIQGRIDHLSVDLKGQRIFVAAVENGTLEVIDVKSGRQVHTIGDLAEPQGVYYDASTERLVVACADGALKIFDGTTFQLLVTVKLPDDADNIRYDARRKGVVVGYAGAKQLRKRTEGTGGLAFLDLNGDATGEVVIDVHPESFRLEEGGNRIFVNVPEKKEIEVIDSTKLAVMDRWSVTSAEGNFPMAIDEIHHRLFVGTWTPPRLLVIDTESGKEVTSVEIAERSDDLFYDSRHARIYVLASGGFVEVLRQKDPEHYESIGRYPTPAHTQTGLFVPEWRKLFAAVRKQGNQSAEVRVYAVN